LVDAPFVFFFADARDFGAAADDSLPALSEFLAWVMDFRAAQGSTTLAPLEFAFFFMVFSDQSYNTSTLQPKRQAEAVVDLDQ
jgi:hypothetical protein